MEDLEKRVIEDGREGPVETWYAGELTTLRVLKESLDSFVEEHPDVSELPIEVFYEMIRIFKKGIRKDLEEIYETEFENEFERRVLN